jgi:hypothetical protein
MSDIHAKLAAYFQRHVPEASYGHAGYWYNEPLSQYPTPADVERLARAFLEDTTFQALRLGTWLGTPDGRVIAAAVRQVLPSPYRPYEQLFVAALIRAAQLQAQGEKAKAKKWLVGAVGTGAAATLLFVAGRSG